MRKTLREAAMNTRMQAWLVVILLFVPSAACAREVWSSEDGEQTIDLVSALKESFLFTDEDSATGLWRLRFELDARLGYRSTVELAYEQRLRTVEQAALQELVVLPPQIMAPYRIAQLDNAISVSDAYAYRHELDRALAALHYERADVTIGRQAIGLGRGVLFSASDVFAPFSPLEIDREWRRGVDAIRGDVRLTDTTSFGLIGAFGESWDDSALLGRLRGRTSSGLFDGELVVGKRAEDTMYAGSFSAALGEAEVHGELAFFDTPEAFVDGGLFGGDDMVTKLVVGASYTFNVGNGLTVWGEYHFSGFGSEDMAQAQQRLQEADYVERFLRGDTQIVGRHATAVQANYLVNDLCSLNFVWIANPDDGSGVVAPSATLTLSDNVTIVASLYVPYGDGLDETGLPRSEYGASPVSAFLQFAIYD
jgi:hypothetical protein